MDRQAFKQRMQNLKSYRENNPGKGYWDWKVEAFADGGVNDNLVGSYSNHTGTPTMYVPVTKEYEAVPEGFGEIANVHTPEVTITPQSNISLVEAVDKGRRDAAPYVGAIVAGATLPAMSSTNMLGKAIDLANFDIWRKAKIGWLRDQKANRFAEGGQTGDPEKERFYQATGRSSSGRPLEEGLKPVFSIEDAANMTPIGDAISVKDTYDAVKNRDWLGAGLAALTVLPFVPSGLRNVKAAARYIPTVNRTEQSLINQALGNISKKRDYLSDIANSRNRVLEDINTIPYRNRAEQADKIFGTNYSETYDLLDDLYQHRYFDLPEVQPKDMVASGRLQAKPFAEERFNKTGVGAEPNEFDLWVNTGMYRDPMQLANHEMNHYTDYIISRNIDTSVNNNMLKQLENSLKQTDATDYYRKGTEQKAYMNQLRTMLKQNGDIQNLDKPVSSTLLKKYLDKMSDSDPIKKMFKQHKNINAYTKWFNAIPLLGTTALGANAYFNNNKDE